jgi:hypothetical protein
MFDNSYPTKKSLGNKGGKTNFHYGFGIFLKWNTLFLAYQFHSDSIFQQIWESEMYQKMVYVPTW